MPLPIPRPDEEQGDFMGRCISFVFDEDPNAKRPQAIAMCLSQWRKGQEATGLSNEEGIGALRHADFRKILASFKWYYCKGADVCPKGENKYNEWVKALGLDDTKPYGKSQEAFKWAKDMISLWKEDQENKYYKVLVGFPLESMNGNVYTEAELKAAAETLKGIVPNLNHWSDVKLKGCEFVEAVYEDGAVESILKVPKDLMCPECGKDKKFHEYIDEKHIFNVSLEASCKTNDKRGCIGMEFTGCALLTVDTLPGIPLARIFPVEALIVEKEKKENKLVVSVQVMATGNAGAVPPRSGTPPATEKAMTEDEIKAKMADLRDKIDKATSEKLVDTSALWAEYDGYRDALIKLISAKALGEFYEKHGYLEDKDDEAGDFTPTAEWPDKCWFWVPDSAKGPDGKKSDRKLPFMWPNGTISYPNVRNALVRLNQTKEIPEDAKAKIKARAQRLLKAENPDYEPSESVRIEESPESSLKIADLELKNFKAEQKSKTLEEQVLNAEKMYKEQLVKNSDLEGSVRTLKTNITQLEKSVETANNAELSARKSVLDLQADIQKVRQEAKEQIQSAVNSAKEKMLEAEKQADKAVSEARAKVLEAEAETNKVRLETKSEIQRIQIDAKSQVEAAQRSIGETTVSRDAYKTQMENQKTRADELDGKYQATLTANLELTRKLTTTNEDLLAARKDNDSLSEKLEKSKRLGKVIAKV